MPSRDSLALFAVFCATAVASAIVFLALDQAGPVQVVPVHIVAYRELPPEPAASPITTSSLQSPDAPLQASEPEDEQQPNTSPAALNLRLASYTEERASVDAGVRGLKPSVTDVPHDGAENVRSTPPVQIPLPEAHLPPVAPNPDPAGSAQSTSLKERLAQISPAASERLLVKFRTAESPWPPANIALVGIKDEKVLDLYVRPNTGKWKFIYRYPILASSGVSGPKLRQGDKQVPEGLYGISLLNPNSKYHVSMRVNYPNDFDRRMALNDGRKDLGGDIMIHGKNASVGCLAMGDEASEELFVLAAQTGLQNIKVIIAPTDFRKNGLPSPDPAQPAWVPALYTQVASAMAEFEAPPSGGLLSFFWK